MRDSKHRPPNKWDIASFVTGVLWIVSVIVAAEASDLPTWSAVLFGWLFGGLAWYGMWPLLGRLYSA